jgi:hypothetical protein
MSGSNVRWKNSRLVERNRSKFLIMSEPKHSVIVTAPHAEVQRLHPMVQQALASGPDPATLRELLAVQREWEQGEAKKQFTRALVQLKRDLPTVIHRDAKVDFTSQKGRTQYSHASLAAAVEAVTGPLTMHGFSVSWTPATTERLVTVTCRLTHADGHSEETTISAPPDNSGNKSPAQAVASTITLLQRYTLLSLLGIATADMTDPQPREQQAPNPGRIDADRNLRAAAALKKYGKSREEAEHYLDKKVSEWTAEDLDDLRKWVATEEGESES